MYTTLTTITWYSVITTLTMYSMVLCRLQVNKSYNNNEYTSVAADPALVSLKDCADIAIDTRLQWANKIIEVFQSSTESHTTLRPWDFLLSLDGSVELGTVPNSDADHHKAYPPRFRIPPDTLLGFNQEDQIKRAEFFALGSLIYEIMSGKVPFEDLSDDEVQLAYSRGEFPDDVKSLPLWRSILGCWSLDSGKESEEFIEAQGSDAKDSGFFSHVRNHAEAHPYIFTSQVVGTTVMAASGVALPVLGPAGFAAVGPAAGSAAAAWQASIGVVHAGSLFAWCQSAAMGGAALSGIVASGDGRYGTGIG